jgi:hypothetical protein
MFSLATCSRDAGNQIWKGTVSEQDHERNGGEMNLLETVFQDLRYGARTLTLTDAGGAVVRRSAGSGSLIGRLGLLPPSATNREIASTFVVSENCFSVLASRPSVAARSMR